MSAQHPQNVDADDADADASEQGDATGADADLEAPARWELAADQFLLRCPAERVRS
jgi:hypothetical protein